MSQKVKEKQIEKPPPPISPQNPHSNPITNFVNMVVRYISEPVSEVIANTARRNPIFKKYVCLPPAHVYQWIEKQVDTHVHGQAPEQSAVYKERRALKLGANLLGEAFLFGVVASILALELYRARGKKIAKEYEKGMEDAQLKKQIYEQTIIAEQQEAEIRELRRNVYRLELIALQENARRM